MNNSGSGRRCAAGALALAIGCSSAGGGAGDDDSGATPDARRAIDAGPSAPDAEVGADAGLTAAACAEQWFPATGVSELDYDQFGPVIGSHCAGTNHQEITGVERVVFLGDSVTVGTPPTAAGQVYRAKLSDRLATRFGLEAPDTLWNTANPITGEALISESGDFAVCARWGARADDLLRDSDQIEDCIPPSERDKTHLVIMTVGGNDVAAITQDGATGSVEESWAETREFVGLVRDAAAWFREPGRFPGGVYLVFANLHEFTDATGDVASCGAAEAAGFVEWEDPAALRAMVIWANEQYLSIAVDTGADMVFMLEQFCGHGFHHDDPKSLCYRGPSTPRWLDNTCIHPNPEGHQALAELFETVIAE